MGKVHLQGWGGHIGASVKPITNPTTKEQWLRFWRERERMEVPSRSGKLVEIEIFYASSGAAESPGGRAFDSLVSMKDKAFYIKICEHKNEFVPPSNRPILCIPADGRSIADAWWILHSLR